MAWAFAFSCLSRLRTSLRRSLATALRACSTAPAARRYGQRLRARGKKPTGQDTRHQGARTDRTEENRLTHA
jgi:hypothetical protein